MNARIIGLAEIAKLIPGLAVIVAILGLRTNARVHATIAYRRNFLQIIARHIVCVINHLIGIHEPMIDLS